MSQRQEWNDYELVSLAQEMHEDAIEILHKKYQPLIYKKSRKYFKFLQNKGIELADLVQECTIAFEEAIHNFNPNDQVTFFTFSNICMERQLMTESRKLQRTKYQFLNEALPLETIDDENENSDLINFIQDNSKNPEVGMLLSEEYQEFYRLVVEKLTDLEECVLNLRMQDFNYQEIADILGKDKKSIDNAIQRMKTKLKHMKGVSQGLDKMLE